MRTRRAPEEEPTVSFVARTFMLERIGNRRRAALETGGGTLCVCVYLGPADAGVDLALDAGEVTARVRGGAMPARDFHAALPSGERVRVFGAPPRIRAESDRRAPFEVLVEEEAGGWRRFALLERGGIGGELRTVPGNGALPWRLDVPGAGDPIRALAILHAAERLLRETEGPR